MLSPEWLVRDGLLQPEDIGGHSFPDDFVDYSAVEVFKLKLVRRACANFRAGWAEYLRDEYDRFLHDRRAWVGDYALFMAIKESRGGQAWYDWPADLRHRETGGAAVAAARQELAESVGVYLFGQFLFFRQWHELRRHARERGIRLIGDVPIFVSPDSADVWANPQGYLLDENLKPRVVAGVPPDYFAKTGQLWGNPHYDWDAMRQTGFAWWVARLRATVESVDLVRLDHFRGFCAAWQVPAGEETAVKGHWVPGPAAELFAHLRADLGRLPFIAEDLGEITPDVFALRDALDLPGMKILQFAFDGPKNLFLPHNYPANCIAYTGTHDNDTTHGWWATAPEHEKRFFQKYTGRDGSDVAWDLIRLAWSSVADLAITTVQDVLDLGTESRMNMPGIGQGYWRWRMPTGAMDERTLDRLTEMTEAYGRAR